MEMIKRLFMPRLYFSFGEEAGGDAGGVATEESGGGESGGDAGGAGAEGSGRDDAGAGSDYQVPEAYRGKPWAKGIKSEEDLYKQLDGVQELIGKKSLPPKFEEMTEVQREEYYKTTRPEKAEDYKLPDNLEPDIVDRMKEIFHKKGLSQFRAFELAEEFQKYNEEVKEQAFSKEAWQEELKKSFGNNFEKKAGETAKFIAQNLTEADKKVLELAPNPVLGLIYRFANNLKETHGITDTGLGAGEAGAKGGVNLDEKRAKLRQEIVDLGKRPHTAEEKQSLIKKLNDTYK